MTIYLRKSFFRLTWTNILCSYAATSAPSENGLIFSTRIEFVGLFPRKTLCGKIASIWSFDILAASSSARASSEVFPSIRASVWAKKLERRILWWRWSPDGSLWDFTGAIKSHGISLVPLRENFVSIRYSYNCTWCMSW